MTISEEDWMKALAHISDAEELKATVKGSVYGGIIVGIVATIASLILGPVGLFIGGFIGSIMAYRSMRGSFKPLSSVIKDLSPEQRAKLYKDLGAIRGKISAADYVELLLLVQGKGGFMLKREIIHVLLNFMRGTLQTEVQSPKADKDYQSLD